MKFEIGKEYKTINGIFRMSTDFRVDEYICLGLNDRNYCNPCVKDVL